MKTITFCNEIVSPRCAGEVDSLVSDIFFAIIFGAYTVFIWEIGGGLLTSVTGIISLLFLASIFYQAIDWFRDALGRQTQQPDTGNAPDK